MEVDVELGDLEQEDGSAETPIHCKTCDYTCSEKDTLGEYSCTKQELLSMHIFTEHGGPEPEKKLCDLCDYSCLTNGGLKVHKTSQHLDMINSSECLTSKTETQGVETKKILSEKRYLKIQDRIKNIQSIPKTQRTTEESNELSVLRKQRVLTKKKHSLSLVRPLNNPSILASSQHTDITADEMEVEVYPSFGFDENKASFPSFGFNENKASVPSFDFDENKALVSSLGINESKSSVPDNEKESKVPKLKEKPPSVKAKLVLIDCSLCQMKFLNNQSLMMHNKAEHTNSVC